ncbi:MAG: hypothetical protein COT00_04875 [Candidatus Omnitrophica bacterium CG07_land_8_20_14_0_80_50_8]|nr:MAG: hypothetical protein AUJ71_01920 [Candidatus Omnitrophica bacterium CG1_02_49_16]PIU39843.1 MAG: hypothetical protein COT00_04875 [Candidatus Omnitrophica bacterium CG07_land_8_20_14_0_80_50_8]
MKARSKIAPVRDIIQNVFAHLESTANPFQEDMESIWQELVGVDGFKHSRPVALRKKVLKIVIDSSGWMQELSMRKRGILKGLKRKLGKDKISEINFRIGEF